MYPATSVTDLSAVDAALKGMELQLHSIKDRLRDETLAIPKAKVPLSLSLYLSLRFNFSMAGCRIRVLLIKLGIFSLKSIKILKWLIRVCLVAEKKLEENGF